MPLSRKDVETPRTPRQLREFVERILASVRANPIEREVGNRKRGYYKEFLDEVVPLARFAAQEYDESHMIEPILGNQGYDARVRAGNGSIVDKVEIANPIDGATVAATARDVAQRGWGGLRVGDPGDEVEDLIPIIERIAKKKAVIDYSDATVVFNVSASPPFKGFEVRHEEQISRIVSTLAGAGFKAKRVFVLYPPDRLERIEV